MLESLRKNIGSYFFNYELRHQKRKVVAKNFKYLKSVGVVFNVIDEQSFKDVKEYVKFLREEGIKIVKAIGYYDHKKLPDYLVPSLEFDFISKKELNWYLKPVGSTVDNFVEGHYDALIDLTDNKSFSLQFLFILTRSKFKIGKTAKSGPDMYDLMIDVKEDSNQKYYIEQINYYLNLINKEG